MPCTLVDTEIKAPDPLKIECPSPVHLCHHHCHFFSPLEPALNCILGLVAHLVRKKKKQFTTTSHIFLSPEKPVVFLSKLMLFSISSSVLRCRDFQQSYFHPIPLSLSPSLPLFLDLSASLMDSLWKMMTVVCQQAAGPFSQFTWLRWLPRRRQSSEAT